MTVIKKYFKHILISLTIYAALLATLAFTQNDVKIGYVVNTEILENYSKAIEANETFERESAKWQANIQTLQSEVDSLGFMIMKDRDTWSPSKQKEVMSLAQKKQEDFQRYSQAVQQKAMERRNELFKPVMDGLNAKLEEYGKKYGYTMILGTADGNIVYALNSVNLTEQVIEFLKK